MSTPTDIQAIGTEIAIKWDDHTESFITFATLRANSPSAQVKGERDVFGTVYGGEAPRDHRGVEVTGWERSEEHTSELQSQSNLVCRLLLEKKKQTPNKPISALHT